jgi:hypothetical protein
LPAARRIAKDFARVIAAALAAGAVLAVSACGWEIDPIASVGSSLKKVCGSSDSCSAHDRDPGRY